MKSYEIDVDRIDVEISKLKKERKEACENGNIEKYLRIGNEILIKESKRKYVLMENKVLPKKEGEI